MRIFYYTWNENLQVDLNDTLVQLGHTVIQCHIPFSNYDEDAFFSSNLEQIFLEQQCDFFFSFDFFPLIAKSAEHLKKVYISWVYDCPHLTLFSPYAQSDFVKLFIFDRNLFQLVSKRKTKNVYHMPLAVNTHRLIRQLGIPTNNIVYDNDISFIGSLYEKALYRKINYLPEYLRGYIEGIITAQRKIYGYNFVEGLINKDLENELSKYIKINFTPSYNVHLNQLYADIINAEITARERIDYLIIAAKEAPVTLYSGSKLPSFCKDCRIYHAGTVDYAQQMPQIFRHSKINLNITLRSITSGIPLRALDIMGAGGFLLSNYQPELAEAFSDGKELVLFHSPEDFKNKINYYLLHDDERKAIAQNGFQKVHEHYTYYKELNEILSLAFL